MRAGPAFLQFDWSKAGLSMDLPVFVFSHTKTSFRFLSRQRKYREAFHVVTDLLLQATQREPYRLLFCLDFVCQGLLIVKIILFAFIISSFPVLMQLGLLLCLLHECKHVWNVTRQERNQESSHRIGKCTCYFLISCEMA